MINVTICSSWLDITGLVFRAVFKYLSEVIGNNCNCYTLKCYVSFSVMRSKGKTHPTFQGQVFPHFELVTGYSKE